MKETIRLLMVNRSYKEISKVPVAESQVQTIGLATTGYEAITKAIALSPGIVCMNRTQRIGACRHLRL